MHQKLMMFAALVAAIALGEMLGLTLNTQAHLAYRKAHGRWYQWRHREEIDEAEREAEEGRERDAKKWAGEGAQLPADNGVRLGFERVIRALDGGDEGGALEEAKELLRKSGMSNFPSIILEHHAQEQMRAARHVIALRRSEMSGEDVTDEELQSFLKSVLGGRE